MPLALLALFVGYLLVNAGIRNEHPWAELVTAFGGSPPGPPGISPGQPDSITPPGQGVSVNTPSETSGAPSGGTPAVQAFWAAVVAKFGDKAQNLGVCSCRMIRPHNGGSSSTWSEHSWCNAIDVGGVNATIGAWALANKRRYKIVNAIPPGTAVNSWHFDFAPSHAGQVPPCAN